MSQSRRKKDSLWAEQPHLPQPVLIGEVLQPSGHFHVPPLDLLQQLHVLLVLRAPELDVVLQVRSHQSRAEWQNHLPRPAGHASVDAAQDTVGLLGCERTLLAHVQLFIHQYPQGLFRRAALNHIIPQPVLKLRIALTQFSYRSIPYTAATGATSCNRGVSPFSSQVQCAKSPKKARSQLRAEATCDRHSLPAFSSSTGKHKALATFSKTILISGPSLKAFTWHIAASFSSTKATNLAQ
ncbi:hypothetical protein QYF61_015770 [Mycteria americana]|uniref:Uncharacterized protein n=1 Tax=Mycteria americana TaxID=33587 RepID=A0AAN7N7I1_MYCAM|nr:hypothetical protein QYF61_015770 [Mycteria americana]